MSKNKNKRKSHATKNVRTTVTNVNTTASKSNKEKEILQKRIDQAMDKPENRLSIYYAKKLAGLI